MMKPQAIVEGASERCRRCPSGFVMLADARSQTGFGGFESLILILARQAGIAKRGAAVVLPVCEMAASL